jgi:glycine C-acetyltransferase
MYATLQEQLTNDLETLRTEGLYKAEAAISTPQSARIAVGDQWLLNFCANNYLGLADHPAMITTAQQALERWGFGMASVRFICGTAEIHKELERRISHFLGTEDAILYSHASMRTVAFSRRCWVRRMPSSPTSSIMPASSTAYDSARPPGCAMPTGTWPTWKRNCGVARCPAPADRNRWSLLNGRLRRAARRHRGAAERTARWSWWTIPTPWDLWATGAGTPELFGVQDRVDIVTGTLGKALGGASGGYTAAHKEIVEMLRQRSRPYLFSNSLAPSIAAAGIAMLDLLETSGELLQRLRENTAYFRSEMVARGFEIPESDHPIVPIMIGDAVEAAAMADRLLAEGIYVRAFSFPVVPRGKARIRTQMSAAHSRDDLDQAITAFEKVRR